MATCLSDKFVITKGVDNAFVLTIKQDGTTLPMELNPSDTFLVSLVNLETGVIESEKNATLDSNLLSGKIHFTVTELEADNLVADKGSKADRYYLKPTYKLVIECNTVNNGKFIAKIPEVYVD